jgi:hypothetical protein
MAEPKRDIEVTLAEVALTATGQRAGLTRHVLGAGLLWPRVGTARKSATMELQLQQGAWSAAGRSWPERMLFKESVQGRFAFSLTLTEALTDAAAERFMRALAGQLLKLTGERVEDLDVATLAGNFAAFPLNYLAKAVLKEKAPATLAAGVIDLETGALAAGARILWEVPLTAPAGIYRTVQRRSGRAARPVREDLVPAGGAVGRAVVEARLT